MLLTAAMTIAETKQPSVTVPRAPVSPSSEAPDRPRTASQLDYRSDIDGLRAIAVLAVIGFHAFPTWIRGGFVGVDVFFVISGYLISTILLTGMERGSFSFSQFYIRRIRRIFPALIIVLSGCLVAGWFLLFSHEYMALGKHVAGSAAFVSNFVLWNEAGYFDKAAETKPLLHIWSLGIEEQFYIVWPLLLYLVWKRKSGNAGASGIAAHVQLHFQRDVFRSGGGFLFTTHAILGIDGGCRARLSVAPLGRSGWTVSPIAATCSSNNRSWRRVGINNAQCNGRDRAAAHRCGRADRRRDKKVSGLVGVAAGCRHLPDDRVGSLRLAQ
jgi:hypothetical protein